MFPESSYLLNTCEKVFTLHSNKPSPPQVSVPYPYQPDKELDNNWINELPPGVFNNNIELIELWVTDIHTISLSFSFFFMRHTLNMFYEVQRKKRNKKRLLATFVTSIHFQIKGSLLTLTKDSVNVDNDVLKATWLDDKDRNFVKSCWYSVYE